MAISLELLGFDADLRAAFAALDDPALYPARVASIHKGGFEVLGEEGPRKARLFGTLKRSFRADPGSRPAVGDWVAMRSQGDAPPGIAQILPRKSAFTRRAVGRRTEPQVMVANVDTVFVVVAPDVDFSVRRVERYLATVWESGAEAVVVLNKADLADDPDAFVAAIHEVAADVSVVATRAKAAEGLEALRPHLRCGRTVALVGSSGVGKSTLVNALIGADVQPTQQTRADGRGQHTTTRRALLPIPGPSGEPYEGGMLIDTPGMRELQPWDADEGIAALFSDVERLAEDCRFRDCGHQQEPGCAVRAAVEDGTLSDARFASFHRLRAEQAEQTALANERAWRPAPRGSGGESS